MIDIKRIISVFIAVQNMERKLKAISPKGAKNSEFLFDLESNTDFHSGLSVR